jgi:acylphosphatase
MSADERSRERDEPATFIEEHRSGERPVRRRVVITGRVQGVFFRDTLRRLARARGVSGWARNRPDGAVVAVFEGPEREVAELVNFCHEGPPRARVDQVRVADEQPEGLTGFAIS